VVEEQYDVLDGDGNKTGRILPKIKVHELGLWHASSFIWIYDDNAEVLMQLRSKNKKSFPGVWDVSVAGHIAAGESPEETAVRGEKEEIGVDISSKELVRVEYTSDIVPWLPNKQHPEFCYVYILNRNLDINNLKLEQTELTEVKKIHVNKLQEELKDAVKSKLYAARNPLIYETALKKIIESVGP